MRGIVACSTDNILPIALAEVAIGEVSWPFACHNGSTKSDWMGNRSSWHFLQPNARKRFRFLLYFGVWMDICVDCRFACHTAVFSPTRTA